MTQIDSTIVGALGAVSLVFGYLIGRLQQKRQYDAKTTQKLTPNELERWKVDPEMANIMMEKNPQAVADKRLVTLEERMKNARKEQDDIESEVSGHLKKLDKIVQRIEAANSTAKRQTIKEAELSQWMASVVGIRQRAEDNNSILVSHEMNRRFLKFVSAGRTKPGIIDLMDNRAIDIEISQSMRKNFKLIEKSMQGMDDGNSEEMDNFFNIGDA